MSIAAPSPTPTAALPSGPRLVGIITVTGDYRMSSGFIVPLERDASGFPAPAAASATCAAYARGFGIGMFAAPEVQTAGARPLYFRLVLNAGYRGPGSYSAPPSKAIDGEAAVAIGGGVGASTQLYHSKVGGATTLTVREDGSGAVRFARWGTDETRAGNVAGFMSGSVTWRCA